MAEIPAPKPKLGISRRSVVVWGSSVLAARANAQELRRTLLMATIFPVPGSLTGTALALVYREAFKRMDFNVEFVVVPVVRAEAMSTHGEVDGELHRIKEYADTRPTLRLVPTSHFSDAFAAYAAKPIDLKNGWDSLKNTSLKVDYRFGGVKTERELKNRVDPSRLQTVSSVESGLRKLLAGRSDVYIGVDSAVDSVLQKTEFKDTPIRRVATMETVDGYAFLHVKNAALVEPLSNTLAKMHKDGVIVKLRKQAALDESP